jgi:hypothetical protein
MSTMILPGACVGQVVPVPNACAWIKGVAPDPGFQTRWTENEKRTVDGQDCQIDKMCGRISADSKCPE